MKSNVTVFCLMAATAVAAPANLIDMRDEAVPANAMSAASSWFNALASNVGTARNAAPPTCNMANIHMPTRELPCKRSEPSKAEE